MKSDASTATEYLDSLPPDRRSAIEAVRKVILKNLPRGYTETVNRGMLCYGVPLSRYPDTYNGEPLCYAAIASQKNHLTLYLNNVYGDEKTAQWFRERYKASGKKLDMGKSCVRFKRLDDLALGVVGEAIARTSVDDYIANYEKVRGATSKKPRPPVKAEHPARPKKRPTSPTR